MTSSAQNHQHLYRIDKFKVPSPARAEFLPLARDAQAFLSTRPGFVRGAIFEQAGGPGAFNFVTLVEWESAEAIDAATQAAAARFEAQGLNPQEVRARLGIEVDIGVYRQAPQGPSPRNPAQAD